MKKPLSVFIVLFSFVNYSNAADNSKPNILVIWGDDIGITNLSFNSKGLVGYKTPNIDRTAKEGMTFTYYYVSKAVLPDALLL